jgi:hypothetical protein
VYVVTASIPEAKTISGVRAAVYLRGEECFAFQERGVKCIYYQDDVGDGGDGDGGDGAEHKIDDTLHLRLLFKKEEHAMKFETSISLWNVHQPHFPLKPEVNPLEVLLAPKDLARVKLKDYDGPDSNSPCNSLADFKGTSIASSNGSVIEPSDALAKYQSLEQPEGFSVLSPYRIHLKDKAWCKKNEKKMTYDENNLVAGSWPMHQLIDGLKTRSGLPEVSMKVEQIGAAETVDTGGKRKRVTIEVRFRDPAAEGTVTLKRGSKKIKSCVWHVPVMVADAATFQKCLEWKYQDTHKKWKRRDDELASDAADDGDRSDS